MALVRWNPWHDVFALREQMDQLFGEANGESGRRGNEMLRLPVDIRQTEEAFFIEASVPGLRPDDVELTLDDGVLTIRGEAKSERDNQDRGGYVRRERHTTAVLRQVALPAEVRPDDIAATFENGVLTITVPRAEKGQPKRIPVVAGGIPSARGDTQVIDASSAGDGTAPPRDNSPTGT